MVYQLFNEFIKTFVIEKRDFLSGNNEIVLTQEALGEIIRIYIDNQIEGTDMNFAEKLKTQFRGASDNAKIVFAHASWLYVLGSNSMTASGKINAVNMSLFDMSGYTLREDVFLNKEGISDPGTAYNTSKPLSLRFLISMFNWLLMSSRITTHQDVVDRIEAICLYGNYRQDSYLTNLFDARTSDDIKAKFALEAKKDGAPAKIIILNYLLNLCQPDKYERMASFRDKEAIAKRLFLNEYGSKDGLNIDDQIRVIKENLARQNPDIDLKHLLYHPRIKPLWERVTKASGPKQDTKRYWIYTPGNNGDKWDEFYNQGIMAIGWDEMGDLSQFASKEEIEYKLRELSGQNEVKKTNDALANWQFKHDVSIGDVIIAKKGQTVLLGYGEVSSDFKYDPDRSEYRKYREVRWLKNGEWEMKPPHIVITKTLTDITNISTSHPNFTYYQDLALAVMNGEVIEHPPISNPENQTKHSLNLILYGPPGTGKTYNTVNLAVEIANPKFMIDKPPRTQVKKQYKDLVKEGRIVFTTFHQSMSYEDFIEGIKPMTNDDQEKNISYEVMPGILKALCDRATMSNGSSFEQSYSKLILDLAKDEKKLMTVKTPTGSEFRISLNSNNNLNLHPAPTFQKNASLTKEKIITHIIGKDVPEYFKGYYQGVITLLKDKYGFQDTLIDKSNFVLIIDEINRGNVSQVFGELITLIEDDKRTGMDEALEVILPYSKEKFSVPPNLYIIGTMNTADRSVEALDTALRRRFTFKEFPPLDKIEDDNGTDLMAKEICGFPRKEILKKINDRIKILLDRDHQIGHSYFLDLKEDQELMEVFNRKIIPLLQEYFYGDYAKIGLVLGEKFVIKETLGVKELSTFKYDDVDSLVRENYQLVQFDNTDRFKEAIKSMMSTKNGNDLP